jgi:hypothetical protein
MSATVEYSISDMNTVVVCGSLILFGIVLLGALRTVLDPRIPFVRKLDTVTWQAYAVLAIAAIALLAWRFTDLRRIQSVEIAGVKATLGDLQQKVDTLSDQMEAFFKRKKTEVFDKHNWDQVRKVGTSGKKGVVLEVTLQQEPIVNSVEVFEGALLMPEQDYHVFDQWRGHLASRHPKCSQSLAHNRSVSHSRRPSRTACQGLRRILSGASPDT